MSELYFVRHGERIDHALLEDSNALPLLEEYQQYDPSLSLLGEKQVKEVSDDIILQSKAFDVDATGVNKKNIFIHFSPYLRCCQTADILISELKPKLQAKYPNYKIRFQLLGDFALSEWIHDEMPDKPPFLDSNDAYNMYIPNVKQLKNKSCCSNFRPTIQLGQFNGPHLPYKEYQFNVKTYFKKLLATYDKPAHIDNKDIIIVVSHGYVINNFLSYFINHPIFDEIPEATLNYARIDEEGKWKLFKDSLKLLDNDVDSTLNLETDIIYYKTNFIKKDDYLHGNATSMSKAESEDKPTSLNVPTRPNLVPRTSFKVKTSQPQVHTTHICGAAKDWDPDSKGLQYAISSEFKEKVMNDESFRKAFSLQHHPLYPVTPEVSPNSEPTRSNSVIDLSKLVSNTEINPPIRLKYSHAGEIPIHKLNSKVNSQVNLSTLAQIRSNSSLGNSSSIDLPRRKRSTSSPSRDSYFPLAKSPSPSEGSLDGIKERNEPLALKKMNEEEDEAAIWQYSMSNSLIGDLNRSRSLNQKKSNTTGKSLLAMYHHTLSNDPDESSEMSNSSSGFTDSKNNSESNVNNRLFSLGITNHSNSSNYMHKPKAPIVPVKVRSRKNSLKFIPSVADANPDTPKKKHIFYNLDSDDSGSGSDSDSEEVKEVKAKNQYIWFGQNRE